ncbi:hypothetical protein SLEP1_g24248 [Rubroshorea leprosula]|uniref:Uncharacterized protein n=1 Tax=Rubroshorea leprosula TaxID=152421 RepID=A0AAV5JI26_9ROSI|nr:hypothetical protein SLEP1_g24248 [Rubroshorea leprosula]
MGEIFSPPHLTHVADSLTAPHSLLVSAGQSSSQVSPHLQPSSPLLAATDLLQICCWSCYKYAAEAVADLLLELLSKLLAAAYRSAGVHPAACCTVPSFLSAACCTVPDLLSACCTVPDPLCLLHYTGLALCLLHCAGPSLLAALHRTCCLCWTCCLCRTLLAACAGLCLLHCAGPLSACWTALDLLSACWTALDLLSACCTVPDLLSACCPVPDSLSACTPSWHPTVRTDL